MSPAHRPNCVRAAAAAIAVAIAAALGAWNPPCGADTRDYVLTDVWLDPDVSHPWEAPRQMFGTLTWTFSPGDFENGTGTLSGLDLPWWSESTGPELANTIDTGSIEVTMVGKWHDYGVDVMLALAGGLAEDSVTPIDVASSSFEIQVGIIWQGHVVSGALVPVQPQACLADIDGDGIVGPADLASMLGAWGDCPSCGGDLTGDGAIGADDLAMLLSAWGGCP